MTKDTSFQRRYSGGIAINCFIMAEYTAYAFFSRMNTMAERYRLLKTNFFFEPEKI